MNGLIRVSEETRGLFGNWHGSKKLFPLLLLFWRKQSGGFVAYFGDGFTHVVKNNRSRRRAQKGPASFWLFALEENRAEVLSAALGPADGNAAIGGEVAVQGLLTDVVLVSHSD